MQPVGSPLNDWLARLETFSPAEIELGLERVRRMLERLQLSLPATVFHVAGTNGKGSSAIMLEALLGMTGARIGNYLSPHLNRYNERIRVDGGEASDAQIVAAFERVESVRDDIALTYFEYGTLAALAVFDEAGVDMAILEIGMGGRLDAVNAIEPTAGLITNVALDHCDWLGDDIETIASEKAGIMRSGKAVVFASPSLPQAIVEQAATTGAELIAAGTDYSWSIEGERWSWTGKKTQIRDLAVPSLQGDIQVQNAAGVLALVEAAGLDQLLNKAVIDNALTQLELSGRMQAIDAHGNWLLDVAHNPAAAGELACNVRHRTTSGPLVAVIGMLDDKDVEGVAAALSPEVDYWIAVTANSPRAIEATELARRIANSTGRACLTPASLQQGLDEAGRLAASDGLVLVTGSFYVVGPALRALELYSPR